MGLEEVIELCADIAEYEEAAVVYQSTIAQLYQKLDMISIKIGRLKEHLKIYIERGELPLIIKTGSEIYKLNEKKDLQLGYILSNEKSMADLEIDKRKQELLELLECHIKEIE